MYIVVPHFENGEWIIPLPPDYFDIPKELAINEVDGTFNMTPLENPQALIQEVSKI